MRESCVFLAFNAQIPMPMPMPMTVQDGETTPGRWCGGGDGRTDGWAGWSVGVGMSYIMKTSVRFFAMASQGELKPLAREKERKSIAGTGRQAQPDRMVMNETAPFVSSALHILSSGVMGDIISNVFISADKK